MPADLEALGGFLVAQPVATRAALAGAVARFALARRSRHGPEADRGARGLRPRKTGSLRSPAPIAWAGEGTSPCSQATPSANGMSVVMNGMLVTKATQAGTRSASRGSATASTMPPSSSPARAYAARISAVPARCETAPSERSSRASAAAAR